MNTIHIKSPNSVIVVLGPHRSGTSAMCGLLEALGFLFGNNLIEASYDNQKGFWEKIDIVQLNEFLLRLNGSAWNDWEPSGKIKAQAKLAEPIVAALTDKLRQCIQKESITGLKDPRISILLPVWRKIFSRLGIKPLYVIVVRDPRDVADSLANRNGMEREKGYLLWIKYMLEAEHGTRNSSRIFIKYNHIIDKPEQVAGMLKKALMKSWKKGEWSKNLHELCGIDHRLRHYHATEDLENSALGLEPNTETALKQYYFSIVTKEEDSKKERDIAEAADRLNELYHKHYSVRKKCRLRDRELEYTNGLVQFLKNSGKSVVAAIPTTSSAEEYTRIAGELCSGEQKRTVETVIVINENKEKKLSRQFTRKNIRNFEYIRTISNYPALDISEIVNTAAEKIFLMLYGYNYSMLALVVKEGSLKYERDNVLLIELTKCKK